MKLFTSPRLQFRISQIQLLLGENVICVHMNSAVKFYLFFQSNFHKPILSFLEFILSFQLQASLAAFDTFHHSREQAFNSETFFLHFISINAFIYQDERSYNKVTDSDFEKVVKSADSFLRICEVIV